MNSHLGPGVSPGLVQNRGRRGHAQHHRRIIFTGVLGRHGDGGGRRVPAGRTRGEPHHRGRSQRARAPRLHAIWRIAAAQGPRSRSDLRRWPAAALHQPRPRHARLRMREGDLLHGRENGARLSRDRAARLQRRPHGRQPQPEPPLHLPQDVGRPGFAGNRGRFRRRCAPPSAIRKRSPRSFAFPACCARIRSSSTLPRTTT